MSTSKNRGLGKGLEALFGDVEITLNKEPDSKADKNGAIVLVDIHKIKPNQSQPRQSFSEEKLDELADSIKAHGIIQPLVLRESGTGYEIVAGERRWRAARKAGLKEVPCLIRVLTDEQNALVALIENMQREDLNAMEEAAGLEKMISIFGLTQEEVSKSVGKSRPYVTNSLRLLKLPGPVKEMVADGRLSSGHGRAIAGIKGDSQQMAAAKRCLEANWTVRDIEAYSKNPTEKERKAKAKPRVRNKDILTLEDELKDIFGTKVNIVLGSKKGKIEIEYYSRSELERLLELLQSLK
ncbi:ParB/RepB/Spo0J family partition protein [Bacillota bacterium]